MDVHPIKNGINRYWSIAIYEQGGRDYNNWAIPYPILVKNPIVALK